VTWPPPLEPCPVGQEMRGETAARALRPEVADRVRARAAEWATKPRVVYLAAWLTVLRTYMGRDDLVVGTPAPVESAPSPALLSVGLSGAEPFRAAVAAVTTEWAALRSDPRLPLRIGAGPSNSEVYLVVEDTDEGGSHAVVLTHRKHNNYPNLGKYELTVVWREGLPVEPRLQKKLALCLAETHDSRGALHFMRIYRLCLLEWQRNPSRHEGAFRDAAVGSGDLSRELAETEALIRTWETGEA